jgi:formate hydrogenlyase transcriptional activator
MIAATEARMEELVSENRFRRDLFEQLNVFPIRVPSLRERPDDIPILVRHFVQRFARRLNKAIETIPPATMDILRNQDWPGNVRQLENLISRLVRLTDGPTLQIDPSYIVLNGALVYGRGS